MLGRIAIACSRRVINVGKDVDISYSVAAAAALSAFLLAGKLKHNL
jgi:hypothetical protein